MRLIGASVVYLPTCQRVNVPKACQFLIFVCQCANVPINAKVPKGVPIIQLSEPTCQCARGVPIFQFMLNICKFLEYLGNCSKFISRNKEFKFWHLQNAIKEKRYQPKTFNFVFNGARGINRTIIWLVNFFYLLNFIHPL